MLNQLSTTKKPLEVHKQNGFWRVRGGWIPEKYEVWGSGTTRLHALKRYGEWFKMVKTQS